MDKKHSELCNSLHTLLQSATGQLQSSGSKTTFAGVVKDAVGGGQVQGATGGAGGQNRLGHQIRGRSPSVKRARMEDGIIEENQRDKPSSKPKPVIGTSDSKLTGRKMRSPPADIFVWGIHPDTSIEDIVNDLADSDIKIKETDVFKKSNKDAYLCSYKISVPAADLAKALDPSIWPLRVKVREFIHYARRKPQNDGASGGQAPAGQGQAGSRPPHAQGQGGAHAAQGPQAAQAAAQGSHLQVPGIRLENMFAALARHAATQL